MPFLSKDWRSPGEKWVRYEGGWEMRKTVWATHRGGAKRNNSISGGCCNKEDSSEDSGCELCDDSISNVALSSSTATNRISAVIGSWESGAVFEFDEDQVYKTKTPCLMTHYRTIGFFRNVNRLQIRMSSQKKMTKQLQEIILAAAARSPAPARGTAAAASGVPPAAPAAS
jgi:hypothetical protein